MNESLKYPYDKVHINETILISIILIVQLFISMGHLFPFKAEAYIQFTHEKTVLILGSEES